MRPADKIAEKLNQYMKRTDNLKIDGWRLYLDEGSSVSLGMKDNEIGGPYGSPCADPEFKGGTYIRWSDGSVSTKKIDTTTMEDIDAALKDAKATCYTDPDAPQIPQPEKTPEMNTRNSRIEDVITKDSSILVTTMDKFLTELEKHDYITNIGGSVSAYTSETTLLNSKGLDKRFTLTGFGTYVEVNGKFYSSFSLRDLPSDDEIEHMIETVRNYAEISQKEKPVSAGKLDVILTPSTFGSFVGKYIMSAIDGKAVVEGQSKFSLDDFKDQKKHFGGIDLLVDGLDPIRKGNAPCDSWGTPAGIEYLIKKGRLIAPKLNQKYAGKTGMKPTCAGLTRLNVPNPVEFEELVAGVKNGILVYSLLGMHTQDPIEGNYSLNATGFMIEDEKLACEIEGAALIQGNFFDALNDAKTRFAVFEKLRGKPSFAMKMESNITPAK